jgi:hypothetical protein
MNGSNINSFESYKRLIFVSEISIFDLLIIFAQVKEYFTTEFCKYQDK